MSERCPVCCGDSPGGAAHPRCCLRLYGARMPPALPYTWASLNALAEKVVRRSVSVPGVQPKLSMHLERAAWEGGRESVRRLTLVGMEGSYILKPPVPAYPEMPELEHLTLNMAGLFGIETAPCGLIALEDGPKAFVARRMDRTAQGKLHMEDMCQLTDRLTEQKYRGSLEQVGRAILLHASNPLLDAARFFDVVLFCFLTGNADMHLKNFSLIREADGMIRLSPAYDLLPTALLIPEDREESALALNGKKRRLTRADFLALARSMKLAEKTAHRAVEKCLARVSGALAFIKRGLCGDASQKAFAELMAERAQRLDAGP
jgi:serine/threonine-protein kinase HipA